MSQVSITALTAFFGSEGMWQEGDTKQVPAARAQELEALGLVCINPSDGSEDRETKPESGPDETKPEADTLTTDSVLTKPGNSRTIEIK